MHLNDRQAYSKSFQEEAIMDERKSKKAAGACDTCVFYDYDEDYDTYSCRVNLDQDEMSRFVTHRTASCPFYRFYDEYKSVHKQI